MLPAAAKNKPLWHLTVFPLHPLTTELALARQRLKIGSKEGMVNRLGPKPRLFLLRFSLIHLATSHFSKDATDGACQCAVLRVWNIQAASECLRGNNLGVDGHTLECVTVMFAFKQTWQHLFWYADLFTLANLFICFNCLYFSPWSLLWKTPSVLAHWSPFLVKSR